MPEADHTPITLEEPPETAPTCACPKFEPFDEAYQRFMDLQQRVETVSSMNWALRRVLVSEYKTEALGTAGRWTKDPIFRRYDALTDEANELTEVMVDLWDDLVTRPVRSVDEVLKQIRVIAWQHKSHEPGGDRSDRLTIEAIKAIGVFLGNEP